MAHDLHRLDARRGHSLLPSDEELEKIPHLYATEHTYLDDKVVWLRFFAGPADWYLMELDREEALAFGWVDLGDPQNAELGYFSLQELADLEARTRQGFTVVVERDLYWEPMTFGGLGL